MKMQFGEPRPGAAQFRRQALGYMEKASRESADVAPTA